MNIAIYGGGFDPVHIGHIFPVQYILDKKYVEKVIIIPTYRQPLKEEYSTPFGIRLRMVVEAFRKIDNVIVSDIESRMPLPSYTIYTLKKLKEEHKNENFYLIVGDDEAKNIKKWHRYDELKKYTNFIILRRGYEMSEKEKEFFKDALFCDNPLIDISSSLLRDYIRKGIRVDHLIPNNVVDIIKTEKLYI